jgi:hypothetical protein
MGCSFPQTDGSVFDGPFTVCNCCIARSVSPDTINGITASVRAMASSMSARSAAAGAYNT